MLPLRVTVKNEVINIDNYYDIWYSLLLSLSTSIKYELFCKFENTENIYHAKLDELLDTQLVKKQTAQSIVNMKYKKKAEEICTYIRNTNIKVININHSIYPSNLKNIFDPPVVLYYIGELKNNEKFISIVGSRRYSNYGQKVCMNLAYQLAENNICVVSGMALGIDKYAHLGALEVKGRTIAVLGCGVDVCYPKSNSAIKKRIQENGVIISEYPPQTLAKPYHFPIRNRIVSGLSSGTIIIEANLKSGTLITAGAALEQGRDVFAVPGNIDRINSMGTNQLIKDGAIPITCVEDIFNYYDWGLKERGNSIEKIVEKINEKQIKILKMLLPNELHIDTISKRAQMDINITQYNLLKLELAGLVKKEYGGKYKINIDKCPLNQLNLKK